METFVRSVRSPRARQPRRNAVLTTTTSLATPRRARTMRASHSRRGRIARRRSRLDDGSRRARWRCSRRPSRSPRRASTRPVVLTPIRVRGRTEAKPLTAVEMNTLRVEDHNPAGLLNAAHVRMPRKVRADPLRVARRPAIFGSGTRRIRAPAPTPPDRPTPAHAESSFSSFDPSSPLRRARRDSREASTPSATASPPPTSSASLHGPACRDARRARRRPERRTPKPPRVRS